MVVAAFSLVACAHRANVVVPEPAISPAEIVLADSVEEMKRVKGDVPDYPRDLQLRAVEAKLIALYVVDTTGQVRQETIRFALDAAAPFRFEICRALRNTRYTPIRRDGQARPALFVTPYTFYVGEGVTHYPRARPSTKEIRAAIVQTGIPAALEQMASRPGCR
jgi:hypothetical protein